MVGDVEVAWTVAIYSGSIRRRALASAMAPRPDGRPYPWLSCPSAPSSATEETYLVYQPFAGMCNQFSCLECAVALARITGRTLVLPRWRPQYGYSWCGETADYFEPSALDPLVKCITLDEFAERRASSADGEGIALYRLVLEYNPTWSEKGFELYPLLKTLLDDLEYFREVDKEGKLRLGCGCGPVDAGGDGIATVVKETRLTLTSPLRGIREVSSIFGPISSPVLLLDHAFNILALPSVLDAGERSMLLSALKPNERLRTKLNTFAKESIERPCLSAHVRRTDHWRLAELMKDDRYWPTCNDFAKQLDDQMKKRRLASWLLATDCTEADELKILKSASPNRVDRDGLFENEDDVAIAILDMWLCVGSDFFIGTRGSMYTDYIERFRVGRGAVVDHLFFELDQASSSAAPKEEEAPQDAPDKREDCGA